MNASQTDPRIDALTDLISLQKDALEAFDVAHRLFSKEALKEAVEKITADHKRHLAAMEEQLAHFQDQPAPSAGPRRYLEKGKVFIANLMGDKMLLRALKSNEEELRKAYQVLLDTSSPPSDKSLKSKAMQALADNERHLAVLDQLMAQP
jgi:rubrerythrin